MTVLGFIKNWINRGLKPYNMSLISLTAERIETARLLALEKSGHFNQPIFPLLPQFVRFNPTPVFDAVARHKSSTNRFCSPRADNGYFFSNSYFGSPDAEVAYALVHQLKPKHIIEIGSGNSTKLFREAITDGKLSTKLVSIDPSPRTPIDSTADRVIKQRLEQVPLSFFNETLNRGDILFIDSSHEIRVGNDVLTLLLSIVPALKNGVVIHIHDIFLPFEYPREWLIVNKWEMFKEQYLVQAMLQDSDKYDVLWPGYFLQRTLPGFSEHFSVPHQLAASLWLRKRDWGDAVCQP
jgi:hypothetical protein